MLQVGLTGNIATGKSHVSAKFAELGAFIIDADQITHEILSRGTETYTRILQAFGTAVLDNEGSIDRRALGKIIFHDPEKRERLNHLTHPVIGSEIKRRIENLEDSFNRGIIIIEAALMVEVGSYRKYHALVVVKCRKSLQVARLVARDNLTVEDAMLRIESQMPIEEKIKLADYAIDTSGTMKETHDQVRSVYRELLVREMQR